MGIPSQGDPRARLAVILDGAAREHRVAAARVRRVDVSPIPVRESLQTLIGEGLMSIGPTWDYTVTRLTAAELRELYVVRERLESAALAAAVHRAGPDDHRIATEAATRG